MSNKYGVLSDLQERYYENFFNATCVVSLIDRLVHKAESLHFEGESYRLKEARERREQKKKQRAARAAKVKPSPPKTTP